MKLTTVAQMRALERAAVSAGTPLSELMEQAGLAVAQEAWLMLGVVAGRRILVLTGPGDNGGDGLVAARHLADWEADVAVCMLSPRGKDDANLAQVRDRAIPRFIASEDAGYRLLQEALDQSELVIDALLGIGRSRPIEGALAEIMRRLETARAAARPPSLIAVDVPTGVDADSGRADPLTVRADLTVTFGLAKVGLYMLPAAEHTGRVLVVDIGIPKDAETGVTVELLDTPWVRARLPKRPLSSNKGTFGRVLVAGGSRSYAGAPRLAAEACYRAGAGFVTIACPATVQPMIAAAIAEATWLPLDDRDGALTASSARTITDALAAYDVLLIGPGLGMAGGAPKAVYDTLASIPPDVRACVIDADALNSLAEEPGWPERLTTAAVLTPHPGEMARLLGTSVAAVQDDRLTIAMRAAADWRQVVVLKGAHTIVAAPDGRAVISPHANPLLATAGTGDVLAGVIAGLLAQGMEPFEAAACGVYLHGLAAEELGDEIGDRGLLASDLLPALPPAIRTVLHGKHITSSRMAGLDLASLAGLGPIERAGVQGDARV